MRRKLQILLALAFATLLFPQVSFAGDDVTINDSVSLSVNGANLAVTSGAKINKIIVDSTSFKTTMSGTSTIKVSSGARRTLTVSPSNMASNSICNSSESSVTIGASATGDATGVTVDVSSNTCSGSGSSSGSGGGGVVGVTTGGGSSSPTAAPAPLPTPTPVPPAAPVTVADAARIVAAATAALNSPPPSVMGPSTGVSIGGVVSAVFTKNLGPGVTSSDVKRLQQLLNTDPDTMIAESGAGSPGHESGFYGALTVTAVQKFQSKYGLVSEGTPSTTGYGALGPKTRAAVEMYLGGAEVSVPTSVSPAPTPTAPPTAGPVPSSSAPVVYLTSALAKGKTHSDVKALQQVLNSDSDTVISDSGTGSPGNETDFYGAMTEKAVQKFQQKYGIAVPGDPGYGAVGPKTRAKINELFGAQGSMEMEATPMSAPTPTPTPSVSGSNDDIQAQINAALKRVADLQVQIGGQTVTPPPPAPTPAPPATTSADTSAIEKQIQDAMKKIQEISAQIKAQS